MSAFYIKPMILWILKKCFSSSEHLVPTFPAMYLSPRPLWFDVFYMPRDHIMLKMYFFTHTLFIHLYVTVPSTYYVRYVCRVCDKHKLCINKSIESVVRTYPGVGRGGGRVLIDERYLLLLVERHHLFIQPTCPTLFSQIGPYCKKIFDICAQVPVWSDMKGLQVFLFSR